MTQNRQLLKDMAVEQMFTLGLLLRTLAPATSVSAVHITEGTITFTGETPSLAVSFEAWHDCLPYGFHVQMDTATRRYVVRGFAEGNLRHPEWTEQCHTVVDVEALFRKLIHQHDKNALRPL